MSTLVNRRSLKIIPKIIRKISEEISLRNLKLQRYRYSQYGQDTFFALLFDGEPGFFVDVGARDGINISNTYLLEKRYGWKGICIEPHSGFYRRLVKNRQSLNLQCAVADVGAEKSTLEFAQWRRGARGHSGLVSVDYRHTGLLEQAKHEVVTVDVYSLEAIFEENGVQVVDLLDVDVEGAEYSVVRSINFDKCRINYITVEQGTAEMDSYLSENGYVRLCELGEDAVYMLQV